MAALVREPTATWHTVCSVANHSDLITTTHSGGGIRASRSSS